MLKRFLILLFVITITVIVVSGYFTMMLDEQISTREDIIVDMPKNASVSLIVDTFNDKEMLEPGWLYKIYLKIYTKIYDEKIFPGTYKFSPDNTNLDLIKAVFSGRQRYVVKITYPEGITLNKFASITAKYLDIDSAEFVNYCNSKENLDKFGITANSAEGYLMPETYNFFLNASIKQVVEKLMEQQKKVWNELKSQLKNTKMNKHQILTLASIVEAETPVSAERAIVAGLYLNRLRIGMKLDADPTVQYALKGKKRLSYNDLKVNSPYNTYVRKGLPPGPINSPGRSAIEAVLNPVKHNYLFFVAKGNGTGEHFFSSNFTNHLNNKSRYKRNRRMN